MAIAGGTPPNNHGIGTAEQGAQNIDWVHRATAHNSYGADIGWVLHSGGASKVGSGSRTPVAEKADDNRFKSVFFR